MSHGILVRKRKIFGVFFLAGSMDLGTGTGTYETNGTNVTHGTGTWEWDYGTWRWIL